MTLLGAFMSGRLFFNPSREHVSMFIIERGEKIETGNSVVVNTRTLQAKRPAENSGYFSVGVACKILDLADGSQAVVCVDGYHILYDPDGEISESDIGKACYFKDVDTVTMENVNRTRAGIIEIVEVSSDPVDIEDGADRIIWVKTDITEGSDLEW